MNVTTYYRFSTHEQAEGTSIRRQREDCTKHAGEMGWTITRELVDAGRSAFSGANRDEGSALGDFETEVRSGLRQGGTLLVERLDRISRQGFDETSDFVKLCTRNGVNVATVDGKEFYQAGIKLDTMQVIKMLLKAEVAHEESVKKSDRLLRRYEIDRAEAKLSGMALTKNLPAWLRVGRNGKPEVDPGRDAVIRRIFELADAGSGSLIIVRKLNAEFEPWPPLNGRTATQWNRSRVTRILSDRQVTGEYQPCSKVNGESVPNGDPWPDYFPRIIEQDVFERVQQAASVRQKPAGKRSTVVANLFSGKLKCAECDGWMLFERKRPAGSPYQGGRYKLLHDESTLRCSNNHFGKGCENRATVSYYGFERAMLDKCLSLALDDRSFANRDELSRLLGLVAEARRTQTVAQAGAENLWRSYAAVPSMMKEKLATEAEAKANELAENVADLERQADAASGKADAEAQLSRIAEFREHLYHEDLDIRATHRRKVAQGLAAIVDQIRFTTERVALVSLGGGTQVFSIRKGKASTAFDLRKDIEHPWEKGSRDLAVATVKRRRAMVVAPR